MEKKIEISESLALAIIEYIEEYEERIEGEWGESRSLKELIADGEMPDIYNELLSLIKKHRTWTEK